MWLLNMAEAVVSWGVVEYLLVFTIGVGNTHISLHPYGAKDWSSGM